MVSSSRQMHSENEPERIAQALTRDEPALLSSVDFGPFVAQGEGHGPSVLIGDQSEITLLGGRVETHLEHRMALLARPGDIVLVRQRDPEFEEYLRDDLRMTDVRFVGFTANGVMPVAKCARLDASMLAELAEIAERSGGLTIKAYLTSGHDWRLAQSIGQACNCTIHVCGPAPRISRRANDKLWFAQLARRVLGTDATPPTFASFGPSATAALVRRISTKTGQAVVKVPDSAGSAGNVRLDEVALAGLALPQIRDLILGLLHAAGWQDTYPVLVGVWDDRVRCSPSVQMWLPLPSEGPPIIEGLFEQQVQGEGAAFVGAVAAEVSPDLKERLKQDALELARVLQQLGYFGRCSLDAVICQQSQKRDAIHWIECNGRWGGVSIPMTARRHLFEGSHEGSLLMMQKVFSMKPISTAQLLQLWDDLLARPKKLETGLVLMSPPQHPNGVLVNMMAVADTRSQANRLIETALGRLQASIG